MPDLTFSCIQMDPFGSADPFGGSSGSAGVKAGDNFDAFGASWGTTGPAKSSQVSLKEILRA